MGELHHLVMDVVGVTVGRGELSVVELHELLIPHDSIVCTGVIAVNGWSGCAFVRRR